MPSRSQKPRSPSATHFARFNTRPDRVFRDPAAAGSGTWVAWPTILSCMADTHDDHFVIEASSSKPGETEIG